MLASLLFFWKRHAHPHHKFLISPAPLPFQTRIVYFQYSNIEDLSIRYNDDHNRDYNNDSLPAGPPQSFGAQRGGKGGGVP